MIGLLGVGRELTAGPMETHRRLHRERIEARVAHMTLGGLRTLTTLDMPGKIATRRDVEALLPGWRATERAENQSALPGGAETTVVYRRPRQAENRPSSLYLLTPGPPLKIVVTYDAAGLMLTPAELVD